MGDEIKAAYGIITGLWQFLKAALQDGRLGKAEGRDEYWEWATGVAVEEPLKHGGDERELAQKLYAAAVRYLLEKEADIAARGFGNG